MAMVIALEDTIGCVRGGVGEELDVYGIHRGIRADSTESPTTLIARYTMDPLSSSTISSSGYSLDSAGEEIGRRAFK